MSSFAFSLFLKVETDCAVFRFTSRPFQICGPLVVMDMLVHFKRLFLTKDELSIPGVIGMQGGADWYELRESRIHIEYNLIHHGCILV